MSLKAAIIGATGVVGQELIDIINHGGPVLAETGLFASRSSVGRRFNVAGWECEVQNLADCDFAGYDIALFSVGDDLSAKYVPQAIEAGCAVVDKSNTYRLEPTVPLVVAGVNDEAITADTRLVANPNCTTTILSHALGPVHRAFGLKRVFAATYQSVSGAGRNGIDQLNKELESVHCSAGEIDRTAADIGRIAHNVHARIGRLDELGRCGEEAKLVEESRKILGLPQLGFIAHAVRVPVALGHAMAVTVELDRAAEADGMRAAWRSDPVVRFMPEELPSPLGCAVHDQVEVGRLRREVSLDNGWSFFVCGDNLRIGAALNGWRILELMVKAGAIPGFR